MSYKSVQQECPRKCSAKVLWRKREKHRPLIYVFLFFLFILLLMILIVTVFIYIYYFLLQNDPFPTFLPFQLHFVVCQFIICLELFDVIWTFLTLDIFGRFSSIFLPGFVSLSVSKGVRCTSLQMLFAFCLVLPSPATGLTFSTLAVSKCTRRCSCATRVQ